MALAQSQKNPAKLLQAMAAACKVCVPIKKKKTMARCKKKQHKYTTLKLTASLQQQIILTQGRNSLSVLWQRTG